MLSKEVIRENFKKNTQAHSLVNLLTKRKRPIASELVKEKLQCRNLGMLVQRTNRKLKPYNVEIKPIKGSGREWFWALEGNK